jgi:transposase
MLNRENFDRVYLACGATDMRRSIDGLAAIVQECFRLDPFSTGLFVFCNRKKDRIKILRWEHNGFWLYYRRLERGRFRWPMDKTVDTIQIGMRELNWLLDGLPLEQKQAHQKVNAKAVI